MKKIFVFILLFVFAINYGQKQPKLERLKALRIAFLSNKLNLTTEEAQKFWPIFNQFDDKQMNLRMQKKISLLKLRSENNKTLTDKEMTQLLEESENIETNIQLNRKKLIKDLQGIIAPQKILLLKQAEDEFKKTLLRQFRDRQQLRD